MVRCSDAWKARHRASYFVSCELPYTARAASNLTAQVRPVSVQQGKMHMLNADQHGETRRIARASGSGNEAHMSVAVEVVAPVV